MNRAIYEPADIPKPVAEGVWIVDSGPLHGVLPLRMTILRLADGGLLLHSPTRYVIPLRAAIDTLGPVRAIVAPSTVHWMFCKPWQDAYPAAVMLAVPGLERRGQVRRSGLRIDGAVGAACPPGWAGAIEAITVPGGFGFTEVALFHVPSRTLVVTDLVLNVEAGRLPAWLRPILRAAGSLAPDGRAPPHVRALFRMGGRPARDAAERLLALAPERVIMCHGEPFLADAMFRLGRSLAWLR